MVVSEDGAQPKGAGMRVQAGAVQPVRGVRQGLGMVVACCLIGGCSTLSAMNPANWWHRQEGGKIAEERPPPPGDDDAYPNLSSVPDRPPPLDTEAMKKLTASLVADRTNAQHAAQTVPLADPSSPAASPGLFGVGTTPPPQPASATAPASTAAAPAAPPAASASMPAVTAPAAPAAPPLPAPRRPVATAPLDPLAPAADTTPPASSDQSAAGPAPQAEAAPPPMPAEPPPRPVAAGAPPPPLPTTVPMPAPASGAAATVAFPEGTTALTAPATDEVKAFAGKRGNGVIVVTGFGDAASSDPAAQSAAITLGLTRAQAVADALKQAGVPGNAIRVSAEASGRGASLLLLQ
jgi:outer membrane protein OmpA-like peptidoglycan-associated protein